MMDKIKMGNILIDSYHRVRTEQYASLSRIKNARFELPKNKLIELEEIVYYPYEDIINRMEREIFLLCNSISVYRNFLSTVEGLDIYDALELMVAVKDIQRFPTVSKFWKWAGFSPVAYCRKCGKTKEACRCNSGDYYNANEKRIRGVAPSYNENAKKLLIRIADKLKKGNGYYEEKYLEYEEYEYKKSPELSDIHVQNRAKRKMIKLFLYHLFFNWYESVGREPLKPYAHLPPYELGDD